MMWCELGEKCMMTCYYLLKMFDAWQDDVGLTDVTD